MTNDLKTTDFRVWNLVIYDNHLWRIITVHLISIEIMRIDGNDSLCVKVNQLIPIPLDQKWLLDLGFEKDNFGAFNKDISYFGKKDFWFKILAFSGDYLYIREGDTSASRVKDTLNTLWNKDIMKEFYVHNLQNLYHSLTQKELTYDPSTTSNTTKDQGSPNPKS